MIPQMPICNISAPMPYYSNQTQYANISTPTAQPQQQYISANGVPDYARFTQQPAMMPMYQPQYQQPIAMPYYGGGYGTSGAGGIYTGGGYNPGTSAQLKITAEELGLMLAQGSKDLAEVNKRVDQAIMSIKDAGISFDEEAVRKSLVILVQGPSTGRIIEYLANLIPSDGSYQPAYTNNPTPYDFTGVINPNGSGSYNTGGNYYGGYTGYSQQPSYTTYYQQPQYTTTSYGGYGSSSLGGIDPSMIQNIIQSLLPTMTAQYR